MLIRPASVEDLPRLSECAAEFYASSKFLEGFEIQRFVDSWTHLIANGNGVIFLLLENETIQGTIGGVMYPEMYSGKFVATEFFWYMLAQHRGGGLRLYRAFEQWAIEKGCQQIRMAHLLDSMPEKVAKFYERMGFIAIETNFCKTLG